VAVILNYDSVWCRAAADRTERNTDDRSIGIMGVLYQFNDASHLIFDKIPADRF
jgi:hypothetical protein